MKKILIILLSAATLTFSIAASAGVISPLEVDCNGFGTTPQSYAPVGTATNACSCIWAQTYAGCYPGHPIAFCGKSLFNQLKVASDAAITNQYCSPTHTSDVVGCTASLKYFRSAGHNCPCTSATCS